MNKSSKKFFSENPGWGDFLLLALFTVLMTFHPFYLFGEINFYELGLYLPGIDGILHGLIPHRDFFHLRGAFELYLPALAMQLFGDHVAVLETCFYVGNVLVMVLWLLVGQKIYSTRLIYYLMTLVLIARAFPRVTFTYWGGFRYVWGTAAVLFGVWFFKHARPVWLLLAGIFSVLGLFTSIEIGVCAIAAIVGGLAFSYFYKIQDRRQLRQGFLYYILGCLLVAVPFLTYMAAQQALVPLLDSVYTVVAKMQKVINVEYVDTIPGTPWEVLTILINPVHKNFKHLTPAYLYIFLFIYLFWRARKKQLNTTDACLVCLGLYGLIMYNAAFRLIWAAQFEMALQPEKILFFFLLERALVTMDAKKLYYFLKDKLNMKKDVAQFKIYVIRILTFALIASTVGYAVQRFNKRFFVYKWARNTVLGKERESLKPLYGQETQEVHLPRVKGMTVPLWQARDLELLAEFFDKNTQPGEPVFMYPEMGAYSFVIDRPGVGRFLMTTFAWFQEPWHEEFMQDLQKTAPRYAVLIKDLGPTFPKVYFKIPANKKKFDDVDQYLQAHYTIVAETPTMWIYGRK
ncbi:MAG: hypothetical protein A2787_09740 [Omnitrophica WOR_2 bacterium RIFCSPHIGHO2_01_FULL_48_9]|nr:MAG: hypothetical protein A2787_09740 [Omnitrophica WOR_2 bacterium RIFCSPHIGHO2_01_FULL_48_9]